MSSGLKESPEKGNGREPNGETNGDDRRNADGWALRARAELPADDLKCRTAECAGDVAWAGTEARCAAAYDVSAVKMAKMVSRRIVSWPVKMAAVGRRRHDRHFAFAWRRDRDPQERSCGDGRASGRRASG